MGMEQVHIDHPHQATDRDALQNLAIASHAEGLHDKALELFDQCLLQTPDYWPALYGKGCVLFHLNRLEQAEACLSQAARLAPDDVKVQNNYAYLLGRLKKHELSLLHYGRALAVKPDYCNALSGRASTMISMNRPREALADLDLLVQLKPDDLDARLNQSLMNLLSGNYKDGWRQYECRWQTEGYRPKVDFGAPQLTDINVVSGKTILVHCEQGFGDTIHCIRYLDLLTQAGANVFVIVQGGLIELVKHSFPDVHVCAGNEVLPPLDFHCPMMSLPGACHTTLATIPRRIPYMQVPESRITRWQSQLPKSDRPKIGIVWSGNPMQRKDRLRSLPLAALSGLLQTPGCVFYSLQKQVSDADRLLLGQLGVTGLADEIEDFSDTAAAIMQLDLVISVDTAVAHLAGALGKPLWLLLAFEADWRWLLDRNDSPWYPTARLFRQPVPNAVTELSAAVSNALVALIEQRR